MLLWAKSRPTLLIQWRIVKIVTLRRDQKWLPVPGLRVLVSNVKGSWSVCVWCSGPLHTGQFFISGFHRPCMHADYYIKKLHDGEHLWLSRAPVKHSNCILWAFFRGPKQHWMTCFIQTQHFQNLSNYCPLTPLLSPKDTKCKLID